MNLTGTWGKVFLNWRFVIRKALVTREEVSDTEGKCQTCR